MQFSIVTPCYNAERYIQDTVNSILTQKALNTGRATLDYIVVDGKSSDKTVELIEEQAEGFSQGTFRIISESDHGMYDALSKGLKLAQGEICAYLNAGDLYSPNAFDVIIDVLENNSLQWFTGLQTIYNEKGQLVSCRLPFPYRSRLFECGLYDNLSLPHVQQESTFWRREMLEHIDFERLAEFKYAGDYYLWYCFSKHADLKIVQSHLGGFRVHKGQLSEHKDAYTLELHSVARQPHLLDWCIARLDKVMSLAPGRVRNRMYPGAVISFNHETQQWQ